MASGGWRWGGGERPNLLYRYKDEYRQHDLLSPKWFAHYSFPAFSSVLQLLVLSTSSHFCEVVSSHCCFLHFDLKQISLRRDSSWHVAFVPWMYVVLAIVVLILSAAEAPRCPTTRIASKKICSDCFPEGYYACFYCDESSGTWVIEAS